MTTTIDSAITPEHQAGDERGQPLPGEHEQPDDGDGTEDHQVQADVRRSGGAAQRAQDDRSAFRQRAGAGDQHDQDQHERDQLG
nr:hypothetical protein [Frankia sp. ArI3]